MTELRDTRLEKKIFVNPIQNKLNRSHHHQPACQTTIPALQIDNKLSL
jgi:hypothetical protein